MDDRHCIRIDVLNQTIFERFFVVVFSVLADLKKERRFINGERGRGSKT